MSKVILEHLREKFKKHSDLKIEFSFKKWKTDFLRFYQSQTNYNISKEVTTLSSTIYDGKKSYSFEIVNPDFEKIDDKMNEAIKIVSQLPEDPDFVDVENNLDIATKKEKLDNTQAVPLEDKIALLKKISESVSKYNFKIYGTFVCNVVQTNILNSNGVDKLSTVSPIMLDVKAVSNEESQVTVIETFGGSSFDNFNSDEFIERLENKIQLTKSEIVDVEPGKYEVILSPKAIAEFLMYLIWGAEARVYDEKRSFFEGKIDKKVFPDFITISDEPHNPNLINYDYNHDGHILKKAEIITNGVFKNFLVDNYLSYKTGLKKNAITGENLVLKTGDKSLEEMIKSVKKGLYISNLHYMNFINMKDTSVTGLTRDGTFLIENGKITKVVNNLRYTEKISDVFLGITEIENQAYALPSSGNYGEFKIVSNLMPHVKVEGFKISSSTKTI